MNVLAHNEVYDAILLTLQLASVTVLLLLFFSIPFAWWLAHTRVRFKPVLEAITALPLVLPPTVLGFYLLMGMGPEGPLGILWEGMTGERLAFTFSALVIASCVYSLPFVVQPLLTAFEALDKNIVHAAWTLGASRIKTFVVVVLPLSQRGILTAIVLGFAHTVGEFGVIFMVGGNIPGETKVVSIAVYERVEMLDFTIAHQLSAGLLIFSFSVLFIVYGLNRKWALRT